MGYRKILATSLLAILTACLCSAQKCTIAELGPSKYAAGGAAGDGGWFWQNPLPQGNPLFGVAWLDADTVVAVGSVGTILKSTDGGATWTRQPSGTTNSLYGVSFTDANTGTAVGYLGTILRTTCGE